MSLPENASGSEPMASADRVREGWRFTRRTAVRTAAWSVPAISVVTAAPAFAAGSTTTSPASFAVVASGTASQAATYRVRFSLSNVDAAAVAWSDVTVTLAVAGAELASTQPPGASWSGSAGAYVAAVGTLAADGTTTLTVDLSAKPTSLAVSAAGEGVAVDAATDLTSSLGSGTVVDLAGSGTAGDPYLIGTAGDLNEAARAVNADTSNAAAAKASFRLASDIDYASATFVTFTRTFGGTFDGAGHEIRNLAYTAGAAPLGMFVKVNSGVIKNLALRGVTVTSTAITAQDVAVLAAETQGTSTIDSCSLIDVVIATASGIAGGNVAAVIARCGGTTTVSNNRVVGSRLTGGAGISSITGGKRASAVAGIVTANSTISNNFVSAKVVQGARGAAPMQASFVVANWGGSGTTDIVSGNVVHSGLMQQYSSTSYNDGYGWITAGVPSGQTAPATLSVADNLVSSDNNLRDAAHPDDSTYTTTGASSLPSPQPNALYWFATNGTIGTQLQNPAYWTQGTMGTYTSPSDLALQATYEGIGWDFANVWDWDPVHNVPTLRFTSQA